MSVEPGFEAGTSVAKLLATDRDSGELGRVSYSLSDIPAPARPYFSVAPDSGGGEDGAAPWRRPTK